MSDIKEKYVALAIDQFQKAMPTIKQPFQVLGIWNLNQDVYCWREEADDWKFEVVADARDVEGAIDWVLERMMTFVIPKGMVGIVFRTKDGRSHVSVVPADVGRVLKQACDLGKGCTDGWLGEKLEQPAPGVT